MTSLLRRNAQEPHNSFLNTRRTTESNCAVSRPHSRVAAINELWRFEMSKVRTLALGALLVAGVAGVSAAQAPVTPKPRADSGEHRRGPRPDGQFRRGPGGGREGRGFGRDLNLTEAQKAQIKTIRQKYQPQNKAVRDRAKPFMEAARAARQKGDSAAFRTNMEQARQVMQSGQSPHAGAGGNSAIGG